MKKKLKLIILFVSMVILVLDTKTAARGSGDGVQLCLRTVIPSLFPFLFFSAMLTDAAKGMPAARWIERVLRIGKGCGHFWLVGTIGGYPSAAQAISQEVRSGSMRPKDCNRLLACCCNAGPAFAFGVGFAVLGSTKLCLLAWLIHLLSAFFVGLLTPCPPSETTPIFVPHSVTLSQAMVHAVKTMGMICGWVVLFCVLLTFADQWLLHSLPEAASVLVRGILEISNGCCNLTKIADIRMRFLMFTVFLSFGGLCVAMQTASFLSAAGIRLSVYLMAKVTQAAVSAAIYTGFTAIFFRSFNGDTLIVLSLSAMVIFIYAILNGGIKKITLEIPAKMGYNGGKQLRGDDHAFS